MFMITNRDGDHIEEKEKNLILFIGAFLISYILSYFIVLFGILKGVLMTVGYFAVFIVIGWLIGAVRNKFQK